uniref:Taste receptor type 2 n=1 Tax=Pyxicephalus adspersus TaxID=30357 RepID=A0AAV2ZZ47_PYXAD|nr:TPA: hypothetical protein GDO54_014824 [Pyxicephalus adspersus]
MTSFFLNTCIILGTWKSLINGVKTNRFDLIHLVMGITNILMQSLLTVDHILFWFLEFYDSIHLIVVFPLLFFIRFTYWPMAWLCACYCTVITRFNHRIFIFIKKVICNFLPHLLLLSVIWSLGFTLIQFKCVMYDFSGCMKGAFNATKKSQLGAFYNFSETLIISLDYFFPFFIIVTSLMVTVSSLLTHIWNMNKAGSDFRQNIQLHVNAARTLMLLLLLSIAFYISTITTLTKTYSLENIVVVVSWVMITMFPTAEGAILIQANPKLRNMFLTWLSAGGLLGCRK